MQESNWKSLDFNVASDYTHGSPEHYRTVLRKMLNLPTLLPGETNETISQRPKQTDDSKGIGRKSMQGDLYKGKR